MSPAPARTTDAAILAAARDLLDEGGPDAVTMQAVAVRVGVRAPSLYKHVVSRDALLRAVAEDGIVEIGAALAAVVRGEDPASDLRAMAHAFRSWAHRTPNRYRHVFASSRAADRPPTGLAAAAVAPLLESCAMLVGPERALEAARLLTAYVHGFTSMELAEGFGLGGSVDSAFAFGVDTLVGALGGASERAAGRVAGSDPGGAAA
jgi:AcrR family transcriptional regulator